MRIQRQTLLSVAAALGMLVAAQAGVGQTVKQGDPDAAPANPYEFHSPMVIETIFAPADPSLWKNEGWTPQKPRPWKRGWFTVPEYQDLGKYSCDGLFFRDSDGDGSWNSGLLMRVTPIGGGKIKIEIDAKVLNPGHVHDKLVTLYLEVMNGPEIIATTTMTIKAPKNWRGKAEESGEEGELILASDSLRKSPITSLRITMTTKDY